MIKRAFILMCCVLAFQKGAAQDVDTTIMGMHFLMDEVVVKSAKNGWDVDGFIRRMKEDTSSTKPF